MLVIVDDYVGGCVVFLYYDVGVYVGVVFGCVCYWVMVIGFGYLIDEGLVG